jgi:hypothetical protein
MSVHFLHNPVTGVAKIFALFPTLVFGFHAVSFLCFGADFLAPPVDVFVMKMFDDV